MKILFWASVAVLAYTYIGYPVLLVASTRLKRRAVATHDVVNLPCVSVIIAARNEAGTIRHKIDHTLALTYADDRLEIVVASDASDDGTDTIVEEYAPQGVRLVRAPERRGKEYVQGLAIAAARGDILVFTDAAAMLEPDALYRLVRKFTDPTVGAVSTEDRLVDIEGNPTGEGLYVRYEMWVRRLESDFHSLVGLSGSCFAIRTALCADWSPMLASDFLRALYAARRGYRTVADSSVRATFVAVTSGSAEMRRKVRTFLRGIRVFMANLDLLNPIRHGRFALALASHKLLRFAAPFVLLVLLVASAVGAGGDRIATSALVMQAAFYGLAAAGAARPSLQRHRILRVAYYFTMAQCAMALAWVRYGLGHQQVTWEPSQRQRVVAGDAAATPR